MTIQPIEAHDLLSGLEEHRRCEHSCHGQDTDWHADGNERFVLVHSNCGCYPDAVIVFCQRWLEWPGSVSCYVCGATRYSTEAYTDLGPANPTTR